MEEGESMWQTSKSGFLSAGMDHVDLTSQPPQPPGLD